MSTSTIDPSTVVVGGPSAPVLDLARRLHDTVAQRLAGIAYLLAAEPRLSAELTDRCRSEVEAAMTEMREALSSVGSVEDSSSPAGGGAASVEGEARALREAFPAVELRHNPEDWAGIGPQGLVGSFLAEALRNVRKHATPDGVVVEVARGPDAVVVVSVANDGVGSRRAGGRGTGIGRRLLEVEASLHGALVESGPAGRGRWSARLIVPGEYRR